MQIFIWFLLIVAVFLAPIGAKGEYKVAALVPFSGHYERIGDNIFKAMQLARHDLKANDLTLIKVDSELPAEQIIASIKEHNINVVAGPVFSKDAQKLFDYIIQSNMCFISFSNDRELYNHNCLLLMGFMPEDSVITSALYAASQGYEIYAFLPEDDQYGHIIAFELKSLAKANKIKLMGIQLYAKQNIQLPDIKELSNKTALLIPEIKVLKQVMLKGHNLSGMQLIGSNQWEDESLYHNPNLQGAWFASAPKKSRDKFEQRFMAEYKTRLLKFSALAFDAVACIHNVTKLNNKISKDAFITPGGFMGITGIFKFMPDGTNQRNLSMYQIKDGELIELEAARESFE